MADCTCGELAERGKAHPDCELHGIAAGAAVERGAAAPSARDALLRARRDEQIRIGADALVRSWRRQADPKKQAEQRRTAERHARIVLEALDADRHEVLRRSLGATR